MSLPCLSTEDILEIIPHRPPFLMIDAVTHLDGYESGIGVKMVDADDPVFEGHFPEDPVYPGVLILEAMGQTAAVIACHGSRDAASGAAGPGGRVALISIDKVRFKKPVLPGSRLELHVRTTRGGPGARLWVFSGEAKVDGATVFLAEFTGMVDQRAGTREET